MQILSTFFTLLALTVLNPAPTNPTAAQFEDSITFKIEYLEVPPEVEGMESMLPQNLHMHRKGELVKIEQDVMGGSQTVIVDNEKKESHILMDMIGQKIDVYLDREAIEKAEEEVKEPIIKDLNGTKTILGYRCKKASITNVETGIEQIVFFTKKIDITHKDFKSLKGFPLEYQVTSNGMSMKIVATDVTQTKLSPSIFEIPEGYEQMTMEELNQMFGSK